MLRRTVLLALAAAPALARAQGDPFVPHLRWRTVATAQVAWLPSSVEFASSGELAWFGASGAAARAQLVSTAPLLGLAAPAPVLALSRAGSSGAVPVAVGDDERELFLATQWPGSSASERRTRVERVDARTGGVVWSRELGLECDGAARLFSSRDGSRVLALAHDTQTAQLQLEWFDGASGASLTTLTLPAPVLRAASATADATRVAVVVGGELRVYDQLGALEFAETLQVSTTALALSGDGQWLACGAGARVRTFERFGATWVPSVELTASSNLVAVRAALSDDGATLALGWWNSATTRDVRLEAWDLAAGALRYSRTLGSAAPAPQNFVEALCVSRDGRRVAFGCWGNADAGPEALWVDVASGAELAALDLPGSVRALALDESGTRLAIGAKLVHASSFSTQGEVRLLDSGERRLQLTNDPRTGTPLSFACRAPQASRVLFVVGPRLSQPVPFASGSLWVDRKFAKQKLVPVGSGGTATATVACPAAFAGWELALQALERRPGAGVVVRDELVAPVVF
ncbi:MAG: hypothetical protein NTV21_00290 [Planctomycetota bacterium]|nr:hypothetical protein [Planctomycetota bacterium]